MPVLVKLWGVAIGVAGAVYMSKPVIMKQAIRFWIKGKMCYLGGVLSMAIAIFLLFSASGCRRPWFVDIIGILTLLKGIIVFMFGPSRLASMTAQLLKSSSTSRLRFFAFILLVLGVLLVYSA